MRGLTLNLCVAVLVIGLSACGGGGGSKNRSQPANTNSTLTSSASSSLAVSSSISSVDASLSSARNSSSISMSLSSSSPTSSSLGSSSSLRSLSSASFAAVGGSVRFVPYFEPNSQWTNNIAAQNAMVSILSQFEATLRTSGNWDATIDVYFNDNESVAYASAVAGGWSFSKGYARGEYRVPDAWAKICLGIADPNGVINPVTGVGADIRINWNFTLSQPSANPGLLRHELLHGLGMQGILVSPSWSATTGVTKPNVGAQVYASIFDAGLVDLGNRPLLGDPRGNAQYILNDYSVDSDWSDGNKSGISFVGILDSGAVTLMPVYAANPSGELDGSVDFSHVFGVSYVNDHPDWAVVTEADRALLRGLGYKVVF